MAIGNNTSENSNTKTFAETLFNFEDDSDDKYELVLPPECVVSESSIAGINTSDQTTSLLYEESSEEKRVSFDITKNEYLIVERYINNPENSFYDADDESEPEIDTETIKSLQNLKISHEIEQKTSEVTDENNDIYGKFAMKNGKPVISLETEKHYSIDNVRKEDTLDNCNQITINSSKLAEYISKINVPEDRLFKILIENERNLCDQPVRKNTYDPIENMENKKSDEIEFENVSKAPVLEASKVVVENIRSLKDNPFILKDKSGKI